MELDLKPLMAFCLAGMILISIILAVFFKPTPKKLYQVKFSNGEVLIDSLRDETNTLENDMTKYPKASIISYKEIKK